MDQPVLPSLIPERHATKRARKRALKAPVADTSTNTDSSDPAVFSSDDDPGLDNYVSGGRQKKRYVGSWFQQQPASSDSTFGNDDGNATRRTFARQVDSGIFLGSDETDDSDEFEIDQTAVAASAASMRAGIARLEDKARIKKITFAEAAIQGRVQACIEQGNETIDLWSRGLTELSNSTIAPLANLQYIPMVAKDVAFEHRDPELKLYLSLNNLRMIPGAIFDLQHLTVLTLRSNELTELPPAIGKLCNLKLLNVAQNRLTSLPIELLDLVAPKGKLVDLVVYPNPLFQPAERLDGKGSDGKGSDGQGSDSQGSNGEASETVDETTQLRFTTRRLGRSPMQIRDSRGSLMSAFQLPATYKLGQKIEVYSHSDEDNRPGVFRRETPRPCAVPSLLEASLRACYSSGQLGEMQHYIPDGMPQLQQLVKRAMMQRDTGGRWCSRCRRLMIVPPMEWIEWREVFKHDVSPGNGSVPPVIRPISQADDERAVPFLHRACSWWCGPKD